MKVKILEMHGHEFWYGSSDSYDYEGCHTWYSQGETSEWEDISEEDYEILKKCVNKQNKNHNTKFVLVAEKDLNVKKLVSNYVKKANAEAVAAEKQRVAQQEKKKLYNNLKKEFGV